MTTLVAAQSSPLLVQAVYSFKGKNNDELCFTKGDIITVTQREDGGWWEGTLSGTTGWFPSNYVKECKPQDAIMRDAKTSPVKLPDLTAQQKIYRNLVLKDLIDSEKAHVAELQTLVNNFLHPLEKSEILTRDEYRQLVCNMDAVVHTHTKLLASLEVAAESSPSEQRVGRIFLSSAPHVKQIHMNYCSSHPRAVCILNKHKEPLNSFMETQGAASPGLLVLTTGLSKPFRRLEKYTGILQEMERHMEENHADRGDTQRSVAVYKDMWAACSARRRQKEQELEVLTGGVRGWEGEELSTLGEILHMGSVAVGPEHRDRYLVLFPSTLLVLSVSTRMSGFIYEGKLPLSGISVNPLPETEHVKNAFEISGPLIDRILAICQTKDDQQAWVEHLELAIRTVSSGGKTTSLQLQQTHVSCPYTELTAFFARMVRSGVINRALLKRLLYRQFADEGVNIVGVKIRRSHRVECVIFPTKLSFGTFATRTWVVERDDSISSEEHQPLLERQNAVDDSSDNESVASNPFGFIRYFPEEKVIIPELKSDTKKLMLFSDSEKSSFDAPPQPIMQRACEDLSALKMSIDEPERTNRGSLPSPWHPSASFPERSASFDPGSMCITVRSVSKDSSVDPRVQKAISPSPSKEEPTYSYHFVQVTHGMQGNYCKYCTSPRSSDSGLADIVTPDLTGVDMSKRLPTESAEFESQCICSSPFSTPRTSAPPSLTSENILTDSRPQEVQTYRSGMYAHWWLKTKIPADAVRTHSSGKMLVMKLTCLACP